MSVLNIILTFIIFLLILINFKKHKIDQNIINKNNELNEEYSRKKELFDNLNNEYSITQKLLQEKKTRVKELDEEYNELKNKLVEESNNINNTINSLKDQIFEKAKESADLEYSSYREQLEREYTTLTAELLEQTNEQINEIRENTNHLNDLKNKQNAYLKERKRHEEMQAKQDYYRLNLSTIDINDIQKLRDIQSNFSKKEAIDKIIYDVYYKPAYDILMNHLFNTKDKVSGIYKITCIETEKGYIGQSIDMRTRLKDHIKNAISYNAPNNKLYQDMKQYKPENFTFEILEEVSKDKLNERENYWIEFYSTKELGLNSTRGGAKEN